MHFLWNNQILIFPGYQCRENVTKNTLYFPQISLSLNNFFGLINCYSYIVLYEKNKFLSHTVLIELKINI